MLMISKARRKLIYKKIANFLTPCGAMIPKSGSPQWERKNWWLKKAGLKIGKNVIIASDFYCLTELEENITVDDYAVIGSGIKIYNFNLVNIASLTLIASDVTLVNGGHDRDSLIPFSGPLNIGRGCWIGNGARIVGALTIGDHVIVGAGSVVLKDVPDFSIVAGNPARIIGERTVPPKVWRTDNAYFNSLTFEAID